MTYQHMKVMVVQRSHERAREQFETTINTTDVEREERRRGMTKIIDGVPVHCLLAAFCDGVRSMHRDIKFAVHRNGKTVWVDGNPVNCELWAYFDGDQYAAMRLGYADYSVQSGNNKFAVYSRTIKNEKFKEDREQHHMVMADSMDRALKAVKKHLRRYQTSEVALMSLNDFQSKVSMGGWAASSAFREAFQLVTQHGSFHNEMRALINNDHQFNDPIFGAAVKTMIEKLDEQMARQYEAHHGYYVQVREYLGEQVFDVITVLDVKKATGRSVGAHRTFKAEELAEVDENLAHKMAALSMLDDGAFVEGLGHKVNPTSYWVLK